MVEGAHVRAGKGSALTFHSDPMLSQVRTDAEGFTPSRTSRPGRPSSLSMPARRACTEAPVLLAAGGEARRDFALLPGPNIRGQVIAEDGSPLGKAMVQVGQPRRNAFGHDLADADGRFAIEDLNTDEYYLEVIESGTGLPCARLEAVRPGIEELRIVVRESERSRSYIAGKVVGPDGKGIRGARVFYPWDRPLGYVPQETTGPLGGFRAGPLPAAVYEISVQAEGLPRAWFGKHELAPGKTLDLGTLRLEQPGFLVARIRREDGKPLQEIAYRITDAEDRVPVHVHLPDEPERRDPLAPGRHRIEARGKGIEPFAADVEIVVGQETELEVVLRARGGGHRGVSARRLMPRYPVSQRAELGCSSPVVGAAITGSSSAASVPSGSVSRIRRHAPERNLR